ncbi:hypothetical protein [Nostoc sp.]|uniref:hypothetical protein n=1 Tax=Nostoc sp. TaxID=1180 RepID=UPI002FFBCFD2
MGLNSIAVSKALSTVPDLITGENSKNQRSLPSGGYVESKVQFPLLRSLPSPCIKIDRLTHSPLFNSFQICSPYPA